MPEQSSPTSAFVQELHIQSASIDYGEQKELLDALYEKQGVDVFVSSYSAIQTKEGELFSYCVWPAEVTNQLMPVTDFIFMIPAGKSEEHLQVKWEDVMSEFGAEYLEDSGLYPLRYRATRFPDVEMVKRLQM